MNPRVSATLVLLVAALVGNGCSDSDGSSSRTLPHTRTVSANAPAAPCHPPRVEYSPYPGHGDGLDQLPWVRGEPASSGLVALLWYWPKKWSKQHLREARIFTGGVAPEGYNVKILWAFLAPSAKGRGGSELVVEGDRLDGAGATRQEFAAIGYAGQRGAPSFASIIDIPRSGCWRLSLKTGRLSASVDFRAIHGKGWSDSPRRRPSASVPALLRRPSLRTRLEAHDLDARRTSNVGELILVRDVFARPPWV
jgi:hypothetical protein